MINWANSKYGKIIRFSPKRYCIVVGGRGAGRSHTASVCAISWLYSSERERIIVTRQYENQLAGSIFRECTDRINDLEVSLQELGLWEKTKINSNLIEFEKSLIQGYGFQSNSKKNTTKAKSLASFSKVIMEECNDNEYEEFVQLDNSIRTPNAKIILLANPPAKGHWLNNIFFDLEMVDTPLSKNTFYIPKLKKDWENDVDFIYTNYTNNPKLLPTIKEKYANYGNPDHPSFDPDYYYNQILGYVPAIRQGLIFHNWKKLDFEPNWEEYKLHYGLDFGYNDPTAFVLVGKKETEEGIEIVIKEIFYQTKMTSDQIIQKVKETKKFNCGIVADCARPEIIRELNSAGISTRASEKGKGSIKSGLDYLLKGKIKILGKNLQHEFENYAWATNRISDLKEDPEDAHNHCVDAVRYSLEVLSKNSMSPLEYLEFMLNSDQIDQKTFEQYKKEFGVI